MHVVFRCKHQWGLSWQSNHCSGTPQLPTLAQSTAPSYLARLPNAGPCCIAGLLKHLGCCCGVRHAGLRLILHRANRQSQDVIALEPAITARCRIMSCASAPWNEGVHEWLRDCLQGMRVRRMLALSAAAFSKNAVCEGQAAGYNHAPG